MRRLSRDTHAASALRIQVRDRRFPRTSLGAESRKLHFAWTLRRPRRQRHPLGGGQAGKRLAPARSIRPVHRDGLSGRELPAAAAVCLVSAGEAFSRGSAAPRWPHRAPPGHPPPGRRDGTETTPHIRVASMPGRSTPALRAPRGACERIHRHLCRTSAGPRSR